MTLFGQPPGRRGVVIAGAFFGCALVAGVLILWGAGPGWAGPGWGAGADGEPGADGGAGWLAFLTDSGAECPVVAEGGPKAGVSFVSPRGPAGAGVFDPLERVGAEWVAVLPYAFLTRDDEVGFDRERQWWGERTEGAAALIRGARSRGMRVMLKPHLWQGGQNWVGDYAPGTDEGWRRFEEAYRTYILAFASVAAEEGVDLFVIGTELDRTVRERPEYWLALIREIRGVYPGALTYAANWDGVADMPFWGELDYIGVDAFFPLSDAAMPGVEELEEAWQPIVRELAALCRRYERPVLFAEYGYRSIDGAAGEQWTMPPERASGVPVNTAAQMNAYEALFRSWWDRPWFAGGFLWKWFPEDEARAGRMRADYTPQHKPVEGLIREWYVGAGAGAGADAGDR